jgi:GT2 family glycosyltransferase
MSVPITVVVCTRNRANYLADCLLSILRNSFTSFELLVVDQSSNNETWLLVKSLSDHRLRYVPTSTRGVAKSRNLAIKEAKGDFLFSTDDDCIVTEDWVSNMLQGFDTYPEVYAVFGRVLGYGGQYDSVAHHFAKSEYGMGTHATRGDGKICNALIGIETAQVFSSPCLPYENVGSGNNVGFRKDIFDRIGDFCISLGTGTCMRSGEDVEFVYRMLKHNYKVLYSPRPLVYHNRWLNRAEELQLQKGYTLGVTAVFTYYWLQGDQLSGTFLRYRFRKLLSKIKHSCRSEGLREGLKSSSEILSYIWGVMSGLYLLQVYKEHGG